MEGTKFLLVSTFLTCLLLSDVTCQCTQTTVAGTHAPAAGTFCAGDLIFEDTFDTLDLQKWQHESTLSGGGNWEFQWYTNNRTNSYVQDGNLHIVPTLLADQFGEDFLYSGQLDILGGSPADECTNPQWYGCQRTGTADSALNPVKSARLRSLYSFSFKYGKVEVRAKLPSGDWLWPAIWMLPRFNQYAGWPASGEIDIMESRGNKNLVGSDGRNLGSQEASSTLHWGPDWSQNRYFLTTFAREIPGGYDEDFHNFQVVWTPDNIQFLIDDVELGVVNPPAGGFWELGGFDGTGLDSPWKRNSRMAPFDQEFYIIMNVAAGGVNGFFPDDASNGNGAKPWSNSGGQASTDFWKGKDTWYPTWHPETDSSHMQIDYVRVWAV